MKIGILKMKAKNKRRNKNQNLHFKQAINWAFTIISTNKSWKYFPKTKKQNHTSTISFVSP